MLMNKKIFSKTTRETCGQAT